RPESKTVLLRITPRLIPFLLQTLLSYEYQFNVPLPKKCSVSLADSPGHFQKRIPISYIFATQIGEGTQKAQNGAAKSTRNSLFCHLPVALILAAVVQSWTTAK